MICICRILSDISSISICCISISRFMDLLLACVCVVSFTYLEMPCVTYSEIPCDIVTYVQTCWPIVIFLDEFIISFHSWFPDMFNQFISCQPLESTGSPRVPLSAQGERCQRLHFGVDYHLGGPPFCALAPGESEKSWEYPNSWFWLNQKKQSGCHNFGNLPFLAISGTDPRRFWPVMWLKAPLRCERATLWCQRGSTTCRACDAASDVAWWQWGGRGCLTMGTQKSDGLWVLGMVQHLGSIVLCLCCNMLGYPKWYRIGDTPIPIP